MAKWQLALVAAFIVVYAAVILIVGEPVWLIPGVILAVLVVGYGMFNRKETERIMERHGGDTEAALSDETEPFPSAHLISDDDRPAGDTPEAHDEINPRDIPRDNPARQEAEAQADGGETQGNVEGAQGGPETSSSRAE